MKQMTKITAFEGGETSRACEVLLGNNATLLYSDDDDELLALDFKPGILGICVVELPSLPENHEYCTKEEAEYFCTWREGFGTLCWVSKPGDAPVFGYTKTKKPAFNPQPGSLWIHIVSGKRFLLTGLPGTGYCLVSSSGAWFISALSGTKLGAFGGQEHLFEEVPDFAYF